MGPHTKRIQKNDGKKAEELTRQALLHLVKTELFVFQRLYDTTSARGGIIPEQPSDFIGLFRGRGGLIEVKSSLTKHGLRDCVLREVFTTNQIKSARLWKRSGGFAICVYVCLANNWAEVWDMGVVANAYLSPPRQRQLPGVCFSYSPSDAPTLAKYIREAICRGQ